VSDSRPDPDLLLRRIREEEELEHRAKLKIFFGACAGVGKTFAMLVEAHERRRAGADVAVGVVETHGRPETEALLEGLEILPQREVEYRGTRLKEFDLDAALVRKPDLLLIDELAHTNAPGSRHAKRWLDIEEILKAGIDVYTTLNVQHVESLYDVVAQITGVSVRELVPDTVLERADEIELVDLPPDDLLQRLREGKVYLPQQAERARENFFQKGNLIALRELALRLTADRVDAQMESYRRAHDIRRTWAVGGRILVCLGDPGAGLRLIRAARQMASRLGADWLAVHVERPGEMAPSDAARDHIIDLLAYAEELGAETAVLSGVRVADELLAYARERNVSRILVGKPTRPRWLEAIFGSLVGTLVHKSGEIDVFVMTGEAGERPPLRPPMPRRRDDLTSYASSVLAVALATGLAWWMHRHFAPANLIMVYLVAVTSVAVSFGRGPAILASLLSVAAFDFFFVAPSFTFAVSDTQYAVTFGVMLAVALVISTMASRLRQQSDAARRRERRTAALYSLSRDLAGIADRAELLAMALRHVEDIFETRAMVLLPDGGGRLAPAAGMAPSLAPDDHDRGVAQWAFDRAQPAGQGTPTLPAARGLYMPLRGSRGPVGVLGVLPAAGRRAVAPDQLRLLETFASQIALALERSQLAEQAETARVRLESERLRETLLSSVSHDLRTPLAVITGAGTSLLAADVELPEATRRELVETIVDESQRLNRLVGNLLDMTRLESSALKIREEWHSLEEVLGAALRRLESRLTGRQVSVALPDDLPLLPLDDVLMEQVFHNLIDNALKYTPAGSPLEISAAIEGEQAIVELADRGPGVPPGEEESLFEKFHRLRREGEPGGVGLGLAICRGILRAHGGEIRAANRPGGGAVFRLELPLGGTPPTVAAEEATSSSGAPLQSGEGAAERD
jgi:two-component system sensor histidine kinase KdpD